MPTSLTLKQKRFCDFYLTGNGNATDAVINAGYNVKQKNGKPDRMVARNIASENLAKLGILAYINERLEAVGLNNAVVLKHHSFLVNQFADLSVKAKAIDMYYKKVGAYKTDKAEIGANEKLEEFLDRAAKLLPD